MKPALMKRMELVRGQSIDRTFGRIAVVPEIFAIGKEITLAPFNLRGIIIALLHILQQLLFAQRDAVLLKARRRQNLAQYGQALVEIFGQKVEADTALSIAHAGVQEGRQKGQPLLHFFSGPGFGAAARQQVTGQIRQTLFARRFHVLTGAHINDDADQR